MVILVIQHRVTDYQGWKKAFDSDPIGRAKNGVTRHTIYRPAEDPNRVIVNLEFRSLEQAQKFLPALHELWKRVGAKLGFDGPGGVDAHILEEVERIEY